MEITPQEFTDKINALAADPQRPGSHPDYAVELVQKPFGYDLQAIGDTDMQFIRDCYRDVYKEFQPKPTVLFPKA
nr:hypothetical protein [Janthinobacterium sp. Marseille]